VSIERTWAHRATDERLDQSAPRDVASHLEAKPAPCAPCVPPGCNQGAFAAATCMSITHCSRLAGWRRCLRNEKVRGSSPLSSTIFNIALTRSFVPLTDELDCRAFFACAPDDAVVELLGRGLPRLRRSALLPSVRERSPRPMQGLSGSLLDPPTKVPAPLTTNKKEDLD